MQQRSVKPARVPVWERAIEKVRELVPEPFQALHGPRHEASEQREHRQERCAAQVHRYEQQGERPPSPQMRTEIGVHVLLVEANQYDHQRKPLAPPRCPGLRSSEPSCGQELRAPDGHQMNPSQPGPRQGHRPQPSQLHQRAVREYPPSRQRLLLVLLHRHQQWHQRLHRAPRFGR